jgi:hypothetical protein
MKIDHIGIFEWQQTASAFSISKSDINRVCKYKLNQPEHIRKVSFAKEYESFINFYHKTLRPPAGSGHRHWITP